MNLRTAGVRALDVVAPVLAQRLALNVFCKPVRGPAPPASTAPHRFTLRDDGPELAVWDWGDGPTVLLVHGWNGAAAQMAAFAGPLQEAGCYAAAADMPAHGASGGRRANVVDFAEAILRLGRRLGPVHAVIAHSFGATAACIALARGLRAERAVLLAPAADLPGYARRFARAAGLSDASGEAMLARLDRQLGGFHAYDPVRLAAAQSARLLVLHDPADREVPFAQGLSIAQAWPGGRLEAMPGRGHTRLLRDPEAVRKAVAFVTDGRAPSLTLRTA